MQESSHQAIPMYAMQCLIQVLNNFICKLTWFKDARADGSAVMSTGSLLVASLLRFATSGIEKFHFSNYFDHFLNFSCEL